VRFGAECDRSTSERADPEGRECYELHTARWIEPINGPKQATETFLNEVLAIMISRVILANDVVHQRGVLLDHGCARLRAIPATLANTLNQIRIRAQALL
jgi:hypothetical protein